jgi:nicotinamidase-related amidase
MKEALLIVDIQNDYFEGGKMALDGAEKASNNARIALEYFRNRRTPIIHVKHVDVQDQLTFFKPDDAWGTEIHHSVKPNEYEPVFIKHTPNAFYQTDLLKHLKNEGITNLTICGMMTHMCVDATTRAAKDYGFDIRLLEDACTTMNLEFNGNLVNAELVHVSFVAALGQYYAKPIKTGDL